MMIPYSFKLKQNWADMTLGKFRWVWASVEVARY